MVKPDDVCAHANNLVRISYHPLLIYYSSQQKVFKFVYQPGYSAPGSAASRAACEGKQGYLQERVPASLLEKHAEFYRLQELATYMLHVINSFTVMEIPNAVWP